MTRNDVLHIRRRQPTRLERFVDVALGMPA
jgi:hypothetical protein